MTVPRKKASLQKRTKTKSHALVPALPANPESIEQRKAKRKLQKLDAVCLVVLYQSGKVNYTWSFESKLPIGNVLVRQCLLAASEELEGKELSITTIQDTYYGIEEFLDFCVEQKASGFEINSVADITYQVGRGFLAWYLRKYPGRVVNRKRYGKFRQIISSYKYRYEGVRNVGGLLKWPDAPKCNEKPTVSYTTEQFNALVEASLHDIKFIMAEMRGFKALCDRSNGLFVREPTLADACMDVAVWELSKFENGFQFKHYSVRAQKIRAKHFVKDLCRLRNITPQEFLAIYDNFGGSWRGAASCIQLIQFRLQKMAVCFLA